MEKQKFYQKAWFMWTTLVFFAPVGIFLLWKYDKNKTPILKSILTVVFIFLFIGIYGDSSDNLDENKTGNNAKTVSKNQTVEVVDFSTMTSADIDIWCNDKNVKCSIKNEYSDTVAVGAFIKQSVAAEKNIYEGESIIITYSEGKEPTTGMKNSLKKAKSYLAYSAFSYSGLIKQLEFEGYTTEEAIYGVDNCGANWNEQAAKKAKSYLDYSSFSRDGLIKQLEFEGFTNDQAIYRVEQNGY